MERNTYKLDVNKRQVKNDIFLVNTYVRPEKRPGTKYVYKATSEWTHSLSWWGKEVGRIRKELGERKP